MSAITFNTLTFTGSPDSDDARAAIYEVNIENAFQIAINPAFTPLAITPANTLKASYLTTLVNRITRCHLASIDNAKAPSALDALVTSSQKAQITAAVVDRIQGGTSVPTLLTDIAS